jgi:Tol biopolymer transport system component
MIGRRLGPYEITAKLGEGGMGEVWRARDFHLGREVALKVLPEAFTADPERTARFEREAKVLASLNHPNIAQIYGLEVQGETRALVMELVEGPTLAERLESGPFPIDEALSLARQIAEALEEAHEKGIVHRDLKPQNIKAPSEGKVKVLDFGLAKAMDPASGASSAADLARSPTLMQSPTLTAARGTQLGVILGTAAYMAPEQARGGTVDKRADIWAFGVVLFEMLTGRRLFEGDTVSDTLAAVLKSEIDFSGLPAATPPTIRTLLRRCLERNAKSRLRDVGEARIVLERDAEAEPATTGELGSVRRSRHVERALFALGALLLAYVAWTVAGRGAGDRAARPVARFHLLPPDGSEISGEDVPVTLSPDGQSVLLGPRSAGGTDALALRRLDTFEARPLAGTEGAYEPFWSPDGRSIAFFTDSLQRTDATGLEAPQKLAVVRDGRGGTWGRDGVILFAPDPAGVIYRIPAAGGEAVPVTRLDRERKEIAHLRPAFLPDGQRFLYLIRSENPDFSGLYAGSLDGTLKKRLLGVQVTVRFAPPDHLLFVQEGRLLARRLDLDRLEPLGEAVVIASDADYVPRFDGLPVSVSDQGRLVYHPKSGEELVRVERVGRDGTRLGTLSEPGYRNLDLSPDGRRLAANRTDPKSQLPEIWVHDLVRDVAVRFATGGSAGGPVWSPDGRKLAYMAVSSTEPRIAMRPAGGGSEQVLWRDALLVEPVDWSPDGRWLLVETGAPGERTNLVLAAADGSGETRPFAASAADENSGRFSPDGRFVAFACDESGREEIYVAPLPPTGEKWRVSRDGGSSPRWIGGGGEILFVRRTGAREATMLVSVSFRAGAGAPELGLPVALGPMPSVDYEPLPDGRELLFSAVAADRITRPPVLIENWTTLLPRR